MNFPAPFLRVLFATSLFVFVYNSFTVYSHLSFLVAVHVPARFSVPFAYSRSFLDRQTASLFCLANNTRSPSPHLFLH